MTNDPPRAFSGQLAKLRGLVAQAPQLPGVYIHKDLGGKVLYVGKAKNLQNRLRSYFVDPERLPLKTRALVQKIADFAIFITQNEHESLILENNLIKHHAPPYNILLRDDKTYPYIKITMNEKWPRILKTRRKKNDGSLYFGPYTNSFLLTTLLRTLWSSFPLVKCTPQIIEQTTRPCNYYHIKKCLGPCALPVEKDHYTHLVEHVTQVLQGRSTEVAKALLSQMKKAAAQLDFETAASLRDQMKAIDELTDQTQAVVLDDGIDLDVVNFAHQDDLYVINFITLRNGKVVDGRNFSFRNKIDYTIEIDSGVEALDTNFDNKTELMVRPVFSFLFQYYQKKEIPDAIIIPEVIYHSHDQFILFKDFISTNSQKNILITGDISLKLLKFIQKNSHNSTNSPENLYKESILGLRKISEKNAKNHLADELKIADKNKETLTEIQNFLGLKAFPRQMECFDISTFQGAGTVASQVVFKDGIPSKKDYRCYIIKEIIGQDDFGSLREVIRRRFQDLNENPPPDVLIIDGGEPQVREVGRILRVLGLGTLCYFGLAKSRTARDFSSSQVHASQERIVRPQRSGRGEANPEAVPETLTLKAGTASFRLLTALRDEAHRFAIQFHRKRRDATSRRSVLDDVKGLGPKRKKILLTAFGSIKALALASADDIAAQANIPKHLADLIVAKIKKTSSS